MRDILRIWNFDDALKEATGRRMFRYCSDEQIGKYFFPYDEQSTFDLDYFPSHYEPPSNQDTSPPQRRTSNSYGFRTIHVPTEVQKKPEVANAEKRYWQSHSIKGQLERDLGINVRYFSARIIFEAVFNALRHPTAEIVQTATHTRYIYEKSQLPLPFTDTQRSKMAASKSAVVHYWDNGQSILELVASNLQNGQNFRTDEAGDYSRTYRLVWKAESDETPSIDRLVGCDIAPDSDSHISEKLLFILQPFVSMSPTLFGHSSTEETTSDDPRLASVGMGLHLLLDTAVSLFQGKVSVRTGNIRMRITKGRKRIPKGQKHLKKYDYLVSIEELPKILPQFPGNMVSISLPEQKPVTKLASPKK